MRTFLFSAFVLLHLVSNACDVCGCSMTSSAAVLPQINRSIVGLRYSHSLFRSAHPTTMGNDFAGIEAKEQFHTLEAIGRYNVTERFHLTAIVPVNFIFQQSTVDDVRNIGLGDIVLMGQFLTINPKLCNGKRAQHQFRAGLGVKFPTGSFNKKLNESMLHANLQNGTGSLDVLLSGIYTLRVDQWGLNTDVSYRINTRNENRYQFGNRIAGRVTAFYWWKLSEEISLLPTLGFAAEQTMPNRDGRKTAPYTGGWGTSAVAGFDMVLKKAVLSFSAMPPLIQKWSDGNVKRAFALEAGVFYNF